MAISKITSASITDATITADDMATGAVEGAMTTQIGGRRNLIINGAMQVAQRGASNTSFTLGYAVDRMYLDQFSATGGTHTYQQLSSDPPVGFRNYLRWQRNSGETATGSMRIYYTGETGASDGIAGNKLTLSFYARAGADYSGGVGAVGLESRIVTGEGTDQTRSGWANGTWTNQVNDIQNNTLTTSWQRFTHTLTSACGNNVSQHAVRFIWNPTGTAGTNDYIEITGVQLEVGSVATPFEHRSFGEELAACQRYYWRFGWPSVHGGQPNVGLGFYLNSARVDMAIDLPVTMRTNPSIVANSGTGYWNAYVNGDDLFNSWSGVNAPTNNTFIIYSTDGLSGSAGNAVLVGKKDSAASLAADAEL